MCISLLLFISRWDDDSNFYCDSNTQSTAAAAVVHAMTKLLIWFSYGIHIFAVGSAIMNFNKNTQFIYLFTLVIFTVNLCSCTISHLTWLTKESIPNSLSQWVAAIVLKLLHVLHSYRYQDVTKTLANSVIKWIGTHLVRKQESLPFYPSTTQHLLVWAVVSVSTLNQFESFNLRKAIIIKVNYISSLLLCCYPLSIQIFHQLPYGCW